MDKKYDFLEFFVNGEVVTREHFFNLYHQIMNFDDDFRYKVYDHVFIDHLFRIHHEMHLFYNIYDYCEHLPFVQSFSND